MYEKMIYVSGALLRITQHTELSIVSQMKKGGLEMLNLFIRLFIKYLNTFCVPALLPS